MAFKKKKNLRGKKLIFRDYCVHYKSFDQHMLFFSDFFNGFSLAWYSTLKTMENCDCL